MEAQVKEIIAEDRRDSATTSARMMICGMRLESTPTGLLSFCLRSSASSRSVCRRIVRPSFGPCGRPRADPVPEGRRLRYGRSRRRALRALVRWESGRGDSGAAS